MKKKSINLKIKCWNDAFYIKSAILEQIKFYGRCGKSLKNASWFEEKKRKEEFLDCVNKIKMLVGYYREISKRMNEWTF